MRIRIAHWLRLLAEKLDPTPTDFWPYVPEDLDDAARSMSGISDVHRGVRPVPSFEWPTDDRCK